MTTAAVNQDVIFNVNSHFEIKVILSSREETYISIDNATSVQDLLENLFDNKVIEDTLNQHVYFQDEILDSDDVLVNKGVNEKSEPIYVVPSVISLNQLDIKVHDGSDKILVDDDDDDEVHTDRGDIIDNNEPEKSDNGEKIRKRVEYNNEKPFTIWIKTTDEYTVHYTVDHTTTVTSVLEWLHQNKRKYIYIIIKYYIFYFFIIIMY